ncbi:LOW QUALITY PROTEIN: hypothetical protein PHMEG_00010396 [Phytophthora megakarya]|uniref:Uncharacterized protein n=1 Tax=Phytophthora megakarya TaxID=4795 RepID=A0A225WG98_9STRA|nr:LOW QUALITY PROTEIN: hypothetical protein PHMEG_00010396 [Phytophthora megakarya]
MHCRRDKSTIGNYYRSNHRVYVVNGITRCVPLGIFRRFQQTKHHIFPVNRVFLKPSSAQLTIPVDDAIQAIIRLPDVGIEGALSSFRGQTPKDQRPNKVLWPKLYRTYLASYPDLPRPCQIAEQGVVPHWYCPSDMSVYGRYRRIIQTGPQTPDDNRTLASPRVTPKYPTLPFMRSELILRKRFYMCRCTRDMHPHLGALTLDRITESFRVPLSSGGRHHPATLSSLVKQFVTTNARNHRMYSGSQNYSGSSNG